MLRDVGEGRRQERRDRDAEVDALFRREYVALVRLAVLLVDDAASAEEVVQDAFSRLLSGWPRVRDTTALDVYLRTSVVNGCRSRLRRRGVRRRTPWPEAATTGSAEDDALRRRGNDRMFEFLTGLPARQRECLVLRYYADMSEAQIAAVLGISAGSVKTHVHRGLRALEWLVDEEVER